MFWLTANVTPAAAPDHVAADADGEPARAEAEAQVSAENAEAAYEAVRARGVEPDPDLVLTEDSAQMPLARAVAA